VHVWAAALDVAPARGAALATTLAADERRRAARFRGPLLSQRFIAARGQLRELLGAYLGQPPSEVSLVYGEHGKPALAPLCHPDGPQFNVAHSAGLALYAITSCGPTGIDVEEVVAFEDMAAVAADFFSTHERHALSRVVPHAFTTAFYSIWTRKEALLKAEGIGLMAPLDSFDVSVPPQPPALLRFEGRPSAPAQWSLTHLQPTARHVGALALARPRADVSCWWWTR
jgi:4'-phosphopantetheinyl transferase